MKKTIIQIEDLPEDILAELELLLEARGIEAKVFIEKRKEGQPNNLENIFEEFNYKGLIPITDEIINDLVGTCESKIPEDCSVTEYSIKSFIAQKKLTHLYELATSTVHPVIRQGAITLYNKLTSNKKQTLITNELFVDLINLTKFEENELEKMILDSKIDYLEDITVENNFGFRLELAAKVLIKKLKSPSF